MTLKPDRYQLILEADTDTDSISFDHVTVSPVPIHKDWRLKILSHGREIFTAHVDEFIVQADTYYELAEMMRRANR